MQERQGLIVWLYSLKPLKQLKKYGNVHYVSRRMKYAYLYVDGKDWETKMSTLANLHFVRSVEASPRNQVRLDFTQILPELRAAQEADRANAQSSAFRLELTASDEE